MGFILFNWDHHCGQQHYKLLLVIVNPVNNIFINHIHWSATSTHHASVTFVGVHKQDFVIDYLDLNNASVYAQTLLGGKLDWGFKAGIQGRMTKINQGWGVPK